MRIRKVLNSLRRHSWKSYPHPYQRYLREFDHDTVSIDYETDGILQYVPRDLCLYRKISVGIVHSTRIFISQSTSVTRCGPRPNSLLWAHSSSYGKRCHFRRCLSHFLSNRFISPAIVSPETVDVEIPKDDAIVIRRGLMVIAKIIQNLANNIFFGKELHMVVLNTFLEDNIINVTRFLSEVNVCCLHCDWTRGEVYYESQKYSTSAVDEDEDEWLGTTADETDTIVLHRFFDKHMDRIGKELLKYYRPATDTSPAVSGKSAWAALCALLVDMGDPFGIPELSSLTRSEHKEYMELMSRYSHRNTDPVKDIFIEASSSRVSTLLDCPFCLT